MNVKNLKIKKRSLKKMKKRVKFTQTKRMKILLKILQTKNLLEVLQDHGNQVQNRPNLINVQHQLINNL